jgi:beta-glucosidase
MRVAQVLSLIICAGCTATSSLRNEKCEQPRAALVEPVKPAANDADLASARYRDPRVPVELRVQDLLSRMTDSEKAAMLSGAGWMESQPNSRLGIPAIKMADGPMGVRNWTGSSALSNATTTTPVTSTAFPAGIAMAATWDLELVRAEGRAIALEVKALGRDMILAPTVNISRTPLA